MPFAMYGSSSFAWCGNGPYAKFKVIIYMILISGPTFFYRKLFPVFFIILMFSILFVALENFNYVYKFLCIFAGIVSLLSYYYLFYKKHILITAVYDMGDRLLFCGKDCEQYVLLTDLIAISHSRVQFDERLTLKTRKEGCFGSVLSFNLPVRVSMSAEHPIAIDLRKRMGKYRIDS